MIPQQDIENKLLDIVQLDTYVKEVAEHIKKATFLTIDYKGLDTFIASYFAGIENTLEVLLTRAFILSQFLGTQPTKKFKDLPEVKELIKTDRTEEALKYIKKKGSYAIQQATNETKIKTNEIIYQGLKDNLGWRDIAKNLQQSIREGGDLQRYWQRVAITEVASALNNGYLSTKEIGTFIIGQGYDDACEQCKKWIIGKVYKIGKEPGTQFEDFDPLSQQYKDLVKYWENYVWIGKDNVGRSASPKKRGEDGQPTIMRLRHELYFPTLPLHPNDRCMWVSFNPELMYADSHGQFIPKKKDPEKWEEWNKKNIKDRY